MIQGIGIDSVDIERFRQWHTYSYQQLQRILFPAEIAYCLEHTRQSAERFAVRFAAREAFFKALSMVAVGNKKPFLTVCRAVEVIKRDNQAPFLMVDWSTLGCGEHPQPSTLLSMTHSRYTASAVVVITKNSS